MGTNIIESAAARESWLAFLNDKQTKQHLGSREERQIRDFIERQGYLPLCEDCRAGVFPRSLPLKRTINKEGSGKKRVVYTFSGDEGIFLKFIAHGLNMYEDRFSDNCYAFRRRVGAKEAALRLRQDRRVRESWCLKADISNYFNSIDVALLLPKLDFLREENPEVHGLLARMLLEECVTEEGRRIREPHGVMAGTPTSPFLANLYLAETDRVFEGKGTLYLRYSDDILLFAESREELLAEREFLYKQFADLKLAVNPDKVSITAPGEAFDFLGVSHCRGEVDLSANTLRKIKGKIRRKSEALRRWQRGKGLTPDKAAIGLIRAMNRKFYGYGDPAYESADDSAGNGEPSGDEFTWSRWFFPLLTTDRGLKEVDAYMREYIRYAVTGRHYKGNYRISHEQLRQWGYVSLVREYYRHRRESIDFLQHI
ncbi:MAG: reverse transcriptase/maturase family protein [Acetatifactor muris]|nr:reverse transcriptase/maturase family protein [Acetatifactor muris]MCM1528043.1 reverse transcriptase/maturase family protein [Bacteroides sp.]